MTPLAVLRDLRAHGHQANVAGMARFGINPTGTLGVPIPYLRRLAKTIGKDHRLAGALWKSGIHEARILAGMVDDPALATEPQMEQWVKAFDSWDVCDQVCLNLFRYTPLAFRKAAEWSRRDGEYVRRAGFAMMAGLAWGDKVAADARFLRFLPLIVRGATDDRNFVKKAVNWALRQIGKRNTALRGAAIAAAKQLLASPSRSARWVASDALRELQQRG